MLSMSIDHLNEMLSIEEEEPITLHNFYQYFDEVSNLSSSRNVVAKIRHRSSGRYLAVKKIQTDSSNELRAFQLIRRINHVNIIQLKALWHYDAQYWIFMELLDTCLAKFYKFVFDSMESRLPMAIIGNVLVASVRGLHHLAANKIMHRDVKPSNILLRCDGSTKLADFGISSVMDESLSCSSYIGSTLYLAPERVKRPGLPYDVRADCWSLGITLWEISHGYLPYPNDLESPLAREYFVGDSDISPLIADQVFPVGFCSIVNGLLTKDCSSRPDYTAIRKYPFYVEMEKYLDGEAGRSEVSAYYTNVITKMQVEIDDN